MCFIAGTLGQGGAELQLYHVLRALRENGARPCVLSLTRGEFWEDRIRALGVPVMWVGQRASRMGRLAKIVRVLRRDRPELLQSQHFYTNLYAYGAARTLGVRDAGTLRSDVIYESQETGAVLGRLSLMAPRVVVANSANAIRNAISLGCPENRLRLLQNSVDTQVYGPSAGRSVAPVTLLAVGRLVPSKRFDRFLRALGSLKNLDLPPWRALIVGDGPVRGSLEGQAAELGLLPDFVEFRGGLPVVAPLYQQADALVMTSDHEGTPNVILEAMSSGLPVVATRVGGIPDLVDDGRTGWLVDKDDDKALMHAIKAAITDRVTRIEMGERARDYVLAQHSLAQLPARLLTLYDSVLA